MTAAKRGEDNFRIVDHQEVDPFGQHYRLFPSLCELGCAKNNRDRIKDPSDPIFLALLIPSLCTIGSLKLQAQLKRDHAGCAITAQTNAK